MRRGLIISGNDNKARKESSFEILVCKCDSIDLILTIETSSSHTFSKMLAKIQEYFFPIPHTDIDEEAMELYRMSSGFKTKEIIRLRAEFLKISGGREAMTKDMFCAMPQIINNPLLDRICVCFGYEASNNTITFEDFLNGVASFNSPGLKEQKLKVAFRIQVSWIC